VSISSNGLVFTGTARPTKEIVLSPEYQGATLITDGATNASGDMITENSGSSNNWRNYYEWKTSEANPQEYTIAVRVTLPQDFDAWETDAFSVGYQTGVPGTFANAVSAQVIESTKTVSVCNAATEHSSTAWGYITCSDAELNNDVGAWNQAGQTAIIK